MHLSFLKYLIDPKTQRPLKVKIIKRTGDFIVEGLLFSNENTYPIVNGIPRFAGYSESNQKDYLKSFSYQWNKWAYIQYESQNIGKPMHHHTRRMWEKITDFKFNLKNKILLDVGCGPGRFLEVVRQKHSKVIGIDMSFAVEPAADFFKRDPYVLVCQANALQLPFKANSFDGIYSIGVLHHTPNPEQGVKEMTRCLKSEGGFAISVYGKNGQYDFPIVNLYRKLFKFLWPVFRHYPPLIYSLFTVYILGSLTKLPFGKYFFYPLKILFPFFNLKDARWSLLDTFDSVTPSYQSTHSHFEVFQWMKKQKLKNIEPSDWPGSAMNANK